MQRVFVLSSTKQPLAPCHPARARELLRKKKAAVLRRYPFTIILKDRKSGDVQPLELKLDPGSKTLGLPTTFWSGGRTKFNRSQQNYLKAHWIDAACVGESGELVRIPESIQPIEIKATGHGARQMCSPDKFGFPRTSAKGAKTVHGFKTGDIARAIVPSGKKAGQHSGRVLVRSSGSFDVKTESGRVQGISWRYFVHQHRADGFQYHLKTSIPPRS